MALESESPTPDPECRMFGPAHWRARGCWLTRQTGSTDFPGGAPGPCPWFKLARSSGGLLARANSQIAAQFARVGPGLESLGADFTPPPLPQVWLGADQRRFAGLRPASAALS